LLGCAVAAQLLILGVSITEGQEAAGSFEQLRSRVSVGDHVIVADGRGREVRGAITDLSASSLTLIVGKDRMEFFEADVETVSRRDSRWNGTFWGLGAGAVLGALIDRSLVEEYGRQDIQVGESVEFIATAAGIGAGIGFTVDALIKGRRVIYVRPPSTRGKASVSPMWGAARRGILVSLRFE
jgi:molybdopterin-binding protein